MSSTPQKIPDTVLIPLSSSSTWEHNELRIALRSWERFCPGKNFLIIGHRPAWLVNITHIPFDDTKNKVENIFRKVKEAAKYFHSFIFANDDHFLLEPLTELPYYYSCELKDFKGSAGDSFYRYVDTTRRLFPQGKYFDIHSPMICHREIIDRLQWKRDVLFKSYYCNTAGVDGVKLEDCKIRGHVRKQDIEKYISGRPFLSTDEFISIDLKKFLFEMFPEKSRFER